MNDELVLNIVGSKGKAKILLVLARHGQLNISRLVKYTGLNHSLLEKHLRELEEAGLIEEQRAGRARLISLRFDNPRLGTILELLKNLENT